MTPFLLGALCTVEYAGKKEGDGTGWQLASAAINSANTQVVLENSPNG